MLRETYQARVIDLQARMQRKSFDALLVIKPEHVRYITGLWGYSTRTEYAMPRRLICAVVPASGDPVLIVPKLEFLFAKRRSWFADVRYHVEWKSATESFGGINLLSVIFKEKSLEGKKIGVEKSFISAALYDLLISELAVSELLSSS